MKGTIVAPDDPKDWDPKYPSTWLSFSNLNGVRFQGGGVIDGSGSKWWAASCKIDRTNVRNNSHLFLPFVSYALCSNLTFFFHLYAAMQRGTNGKILMHCFF